MSDFIRPGETGNMIEEALHRITIIRAPDGSVWILAPDGSVWNGALFAHDGLGYTKGQTSGDFDDDFWMYLAPAGTMIFVTSDMSLYGESRAAQSIPMLQKQFPHLIYVQEGDEALAHALANMRLYGHCAAIDGAIHPMFVAGIASRITAARTDESGPLMIQTQGNMTAYNLKNSPELANMFQTCITNPHEKLRVVMHSTGATAHSLSCGYLRSIGVIPSLMGQAATFATAKLVAAPTTIGGLMGRLYTGAPGASGTNSTTLLMLAALAQPYGLFGGVNFAGSLTEQFQSIIDANPDKTPAI